MVVKHWFTLEHSVYWCRRLDQVNAPAGDARYTLINAIRGLRGCKALHAKARVGAAVHKGRHIKEDNTGSGRAWRLVRRVTWK